MKKDSSNLPITLGFEPTLAGLQACLTPWMKFGASHV